MLLLLRKIRRKLISTDNKVVTYLFYALGEIVLVVIGIMIALQLDEFDREIQNQKTVATYLSQIQEDIAENLIAIKSRDNFYMRYADEIDQLINNEIPAEDFGYPDIYNTGFQYSVISLKDKGYQNLISNIDLTTPEHAELLSELEEINKLKEFREKAVQQLGDQVTSYRDFLSKTQNWYWQSPTDTISQERINYYMHHDLHKNYLRRYQEDFQKEIWAAGFYGLLAHEVYYEIHAFLGSQEKDIHEGVKTFYEKFDKNYLEQFEGSYVPLASERELENFKGFEFKLDSAGQLELLLGSNESLPLSPIDSTIFLLGNSRIEFDTKKGGHKVVFRGTTSFWIKTEK